MYHFYGCSTAPPFHSFHGSEQRCQGWLREGLLGTTRALRGMQGLPASLCIPTCAGAAAVAGPALAPPEEPGTRAGLISGHHHLLWQTQTAATALQDRCTPSCGEKAAKVGPLQHMRRFLNHLLEHFPCKTEKFFKKYCWWVVLSV